MTAADNNDIMARVCLTGKYVGAENNDVLVVARDLLGNNRCCAGCGNHDIGLNGVYQLLGNGRVQNDGNIEFFKLMHLPYNKCTQLALAGRH